MTNHIEISIEDKGWESIDLSKIATASLSAVFDHLNLPQIYEISVLACDDTRIAELNTEFRGKPVPTNVLAWPTYDWPARIDGVVPSDPPNPTKHQPELGDIAISFQTCAAEAVAGNLKFTAHTTHLIVHALLHLLGYDHIRPKDADLMERTETEILAILGVADPY